MTIPKERKLMVDRRHASCHLSVRAVHSQTIDQKDQALIWSVHLARSKSVKATMINRTLRIIVSLILVVLLSPIRGMTDKATGIKFAPKSNGLEIFGVGVRKKGPLKIYSVGMYCNQALKDKMSAISKSKSEKEAISILREGAAEEASFLLEMSFKIGAEKMASAIAESVAPRHKGNKKEVDELKDLIFAGVPAEGATKGTTFQFDCAKSGVAVKVNGNDKGSVSSSSLASAFCDVYLDDKCVSPQMRKSCLENCCCP